MRKRTYLWGKPLLAALVQMSDVFVYCPRENGDVHCNQVNPIIDDDE